MSLDHMHPEDVKAGLRKRFGTIGEFIKAHDLPATGVSDFLRGRTSKRVREAIENALSGSQSIELDSSRIRTPLHQKNRHAA